MRLIDNTLAAKLSQKVWGIGNGVQNPFLRIPAARALFTDAKEKPVVTPHPLPIAFLVCFCIASVLNMNAHQGMLDTRVGNH